MKETTKVRVADDPRGIRAGRVAEIINGKLEAYWTGLVEGRSAEAKVRYDAARARARTWGFDYLTNEQIAGVAPVDILKRYAKVYDRDDDLAASAVLGGEQPPKIMLSGLFSTYEVIAETENRGMSPDQKRRWKAPREKAIGNLIAMTGDKRLTEISRNEALDFQEWWRSRILVEEMDVGTANRHIGHLAKMLREVDQRHRLGLDNPFTDLR